MRTVESKHLLSLGILLAIFMALTAGQINVPTGTAQAAAKEKSATFDIIPDAPTVPGSIPAGTTFFVTGKVYPYRSVNQGTCALNNPNTPSIGTWRAWGTNGDSGKLALHQTVLVETLNSAIEIQGITGVLAPNGDVGPGEQLGGTTGPSEVLTVVGGTNRYFENNGEAIIRPYCNPNAGGTSPFRYDRAFCLGITIDD